MTESKMKEAVMNRNVKSFLRRQIKIAYIFGSSKRNLDMIVFYRNIKKYKRNKPNNPK